MIERSDPSRGRKWESAHARLAGLRWVRVEGFPNHLLFHIPLGEGVRAVLVVHGAMSEESVSGRLESD